MSSSDSDSDRKTSINKPTPKLTAANLTAFSFVEDNKQKKRAISISSCSSGGSLIKSFAAQTQQRAQKQQKRLERKLQRQKQKEARRSGLSSSSDDYSSDLSVGPSSDEDDGTKRQPLKVSALPNTDAAMFTSSAAAAATNEQGKNIVSLLDLFRPIAPSALWRQVDEYEASSDDDDDDDGNPFATSEDKSNSKKTVEEKKKEAEQQRPTVVATITSVILPDVVVLEMAPNVPLLDVGSILCVTLPPLPPPSSSSSSSGEQQQQQTPAAASDEEVPKFVKLGAVAAQLGNVRRCSYVIKVEKLAVAIATVAASTNNTTSSSTVDSQQQQQQPHLFPSFLSVGSPAYAQRSTLVTVDDLDHIIAESQKVTDASTQDDSELPETMTPDFSDDDEERAHKAKKREQRKIIKNRLAEIERAAAGGFTVPTGWGNLGHKQPQQRQQLAGNDEDDGEDDEDDVEFEFDAEGAIISEHAKMAGTRRRAGQQPVLPTPPSSAAAAGGVPVVTRKVSRYVPPVKSAEKKDE